LAGTAVIRWAGDFTIAAAISPTIKNPIAAMNMVATV
jgi:hypothetical protein